MMILDNLYSLSQRSSFTALHALVFWLLRLPYVKPLAAVQCRSSNSLSGPTIDWSRAAALIGTEAWVSLL
jgi:hypothetical protein